jgi:endonuclease/exonuclease/phosphatase family metal-dependent hydrolase
MSGHHKVYRVRGDANEFTPYGLAKGRKYYFRVRALNGSTPSAFTGTQQTVVQSGQQRMRVMTYNIKEAAFDGVSEGGSHVAPWKTARRPAEVALIKRARPDVVGIQEAATLFNANGHPKRQIDLLRASLGHAYALAHTEVPPSQPGTRRTGNYILYRKAAWAPIGRAGHWDLGDRHTAAYQALRNRSTGATVLVANAHLSVGTGRANDVLRREETKRLVHFGHLVTTRYGVPVVYVGDFNSDNCSSHAFNAPAMVMRSHHIADAYNVAQSRKYGNYNTANQYRRRPPHHGDRIDYVFAPHGIGVRSWRLVMKLRHRSFVGPIPSDHNPLVSDLMIPVGR